VVNDVCPCAFKAENVGRKPTRVRARPVAKKTAAPKKPARKKVAKKGRATAKK
jgi:hypothetical protein